MYETTLNREICFEVSSDENDIVYNYRMGINNKEIHRSIANNSNALTKALSVERVPSINFKFCSSEYYCPNSGIRIYVYATRTCKVERFSTLDVTHAIQVSIGNAESRTGWDKGDGIFSAKVFPKNIDELQYIIEDTALDIQMFYLYPFCELFPYKEMQKDYSKRKVDFMLRFHPEVVSYLGKIEEHEYISFASFCRRKDYSIDFCKFIQFNDEFLKWIRDDETAVDNLKAFSKTTTDELYRSLQNYEQISYRKLNNILLNLSSGDYILIRIAKRPKYPRKLKEVMMRFGIKKWRVGKIKVVEMKQRVAYEKLRPYVMIQSFSWRS